MDHVPKGRCPVECASRTPFVCPLVTRPLLLLLVCERERGGGERGGRERGGREEKGEKRERG